MQLRYFVFIHYPTGTLRSMQLLREPLLLQVPIVPTRKCVLLRYNVSIPPVKLWAILDSFSRVLISSDVNLISCLPTMLLHLRRCLSGGKSANDKGALHFLPVSRHSTVLNSLWGAIWWIPVVLACLNTYMQSSFPCIWTPRLVDFVWRDAVLCGTSTCDTHSLDTSFGDASRTTYISIKRVFVSQPTLYY